MFKKIENAFFLISFVTFIFLVSKYYFSEKNIVFTNKSRSSYVTSLDNEKNNLPLLENDTSDVIVYINDLYDLKKKRENGFGKN